MIIIQRIDLKNLVLFYYILGTLVCVTYHDNIYHPISISALGLFLVLNLIKSLNEFKFNKFITAFALYHITIALLYENYLDLFTMTLYSVIVVAMSLTAKYNKTAHKTIAFSVIIMNFINATFLLLSPISYTRYKMLGSIPIKVNYFDGIRYSTAALTALFAMILVFYFQNKSLNNKMVKFATVLSSLYIIFTLSKASVLLGFFISIILTKMFFFKGKQSKFTKIISWLILVLTFLSGWILPAIISLTSRWQINYHSLSSGRDVIWRTYLQYFHQTPLSEKLLGSFFIRTYNDVFQQGYLHPHNQWITILVSTGLIGLTFYFILFVKAYCHVIENGDRVGFSYILALNIFATTDDYVLLTAGCVYAFLLFYFASSKSVNESLVNTT